MLNFKKDIWPIINSDSVASTYVNGKLKINSNEFKPLSDTSLVAINAKIENEMKSNFVGRNRAAKRSLLGLPELQAKANSFGNEMRTNYKSGKNLMVTMDNVMQRDVSPFMANESVATQFSNNNIWISPAEAALIYSGKGIPELIIEKKSHSPLLNGIKIKNPKLDPKELDKISEDMIMHQFDMRIAEVIRDSLVFGGALFFPRFKNDSPATAHMGISQLIRLGVLGKNSISRFVTLDRWNVVFTPDWNPLSSTFIKPSSYFIPFLGSVLNGQRCSRVVTSPAAGYWGTMMTLGWGVSDIPGWIESVLNYDAVMQAIPFMIKQMSLLARTFDTSGMTAMEAGALMDMMEEKNTVRERETGPESVINLDTIGDLKAIQRDFKQVPELVRLLRQDVAARARYPEELIWSSERGAFSSGDSGDSAFEKQTENVRYTHLKVAKQLKEVVMIFVINSLGTSDRVMKALPYTTIEFDNPKLTNARDRSEIAAKVGKSIFDSVAAGISVPIAINIARQLSDNEFTLTSELTAQIEEKQTEKDAHDKRKRELEIEAMEIANKTAAEPPAAPTAPGAEGTKPKPKAAPGASVAEKSTKEAGVKTGHSYSDPLEQRQHEKVGESRTKNIAAVKEEKKQ